jgi:hypothetical protein
MDAAGATSRFHRILLSWDYFELSARADEGKGVYDVLKPVPNTFSSIQVRQRAANGRAGGRGEVEAGTRRGCAMTAAWAGGCRAVHALPHDSKVLCTWCRSIRRCLSR